MESIERKSNRLYSILYKFNTSTKTSQTSQTISARLAAYNGDWSIVYQPPRSLLSVRTLLIALCKSRA